MLLVVVRNNSFTFTVVQNTTVKSVAADRTLETLIKDHKFYDDVIVTLDEPLVEAIVDDVWPVDNVYGIICGEDDDPADAICSDSTYIMQIKPYVFGEPSIAIHELQFRRS